MSQCKDCRYLIPLGIEAPNQPWCQYHHRDSDFDYSCEDFVLKEQKQMKPDLILSIDGKEFKSKGFYMEVDLEHKIDEDGFPAQVTFELTLKNGKKIYYLGKKCGRVFRNIKENK